MRAKLHTWLWSFLPMIGWAAESLGDVSNSMRQPVGGITNAVLKLTYVLGTCLLVTAAMRYNQHRNNSNQVRFSDVVFCTLLGSGLILLALFVQFKYLPSINL